MQIPKVPVVSNVTAVVGRRRENQGTAGAPGNLPGPLERSMQWLVAEVSRAFIELAPANVLSGLMKRINKDVEMLSVSDVATAGGDGGEVEGLGYGSRETVEK